ncbi:hypothetical protein PHMEG_0007928 [Phytophthora megakarya]|uniref:Integrase catalytic domain-containing protein n=1 Tax=Phytophthora megakarya TaxID=4795 RepID=A0A225WK14_9STRA|nr:hypothetical protein PHMEG_0007928 [Phytophthora megakarya]
MSTASHPETDGQTERFNRVVEDVLRSYATSFKSWKSFLPMVEFAINNAVHSSTSLTPFFVNFGRHPSVPALLGLERPLPVQLSENHDAATPTSTDDASAATHYMAADSNLNAECTRSTTRIPSQGPLTRADLGATAVWTSRRLINPISHRPDPVAATESPPANFASNVVPQRSDVVAVPEFVLQREGIVCYVRDAIAAAVDRQKENADRSGRRNVERFRVGDQVLLSTDGISPTSVRNLDANNLTPRYIGPFTVLKVIRDAYRLQLPPTLKLHPTFYVGRLRRYRPASLPSDNPQLLPQDLILMLQLVHAVLQTFQSMCHRPLALGSCATVQLLLLIVMEMFATSRRPSLHIPSHPRYLVRWIGPLDDTWEPRSTLLEDVPRLVEAYESALSAREHPPGAVAKHA